MVTLVQNESRSATELSNQVDVAIFMYEGGDHYGAMTLLSILGFKAMDVHRILRNPELRRKYINDMLAGY